MARWFSGPILLAHLLIGAVPSAAITKGSKAIKADGGNPEAPLSTSNMTKSRGLFFRSRKMVHWRNSQGEVRMGLASQVFLPSPNAPDKPNVLDALSFLSDGAQNAIISEPTYKLSLSNSNLT